MSWARMLGLGLIALAMGWSWSACSTAIEETHVLYVSAEIAECEGVGPRTCLLVREDPEAIWQLFYDSIDGFDYELGTEYVIEVAVERVPSPPADAATERYRLLRILESRQVDAE